MQDFDYVLMDVRRELEKAVAKHGPIASMHEGYAVALEELDEAWTEIKRQNPDPEAVRTELVQVAAMAIRTIVDAVPVGRDLRVSAVAPVHH